jgi:hypothetical protein
VSSGRCGDRPFASAFRLPRAERSPAWLEALGGAGLTVDRARRARLLGDPDPFPIRALAASGDSPVTFDDDGGLPLDPDAADAVLVRAAVGRQRGDALSGLFDGRRVPAKVRAIPVDDPLADALRWPRPAGRRPQARFGAPEVIPCAALGLPETATIRALTPLPGGLAAGSDMGAALLRDGRWAPFPWPPGARRSPRVEAMVAHAGVLHVATTEAWFELALDTGAVRTRRHPADGDDGRDDVRSLLSVGDRLLVGWRTRFVGGEGPPEAISLASDPDGNVWAGTLHGELWVVDGGLVRTFADAKKGRPIRHLAWAAGALWVAAAGALHRFDGASWSTLPGEPSSLLGDGDRLWLIRDGAVSLHPDGMLPALPVERPWCLCLTEGGVGAPPGNAGRALWIGAPGRLVRVPAAP